MHKLIFSSHKPIQSSRKINGFTIVELLIVIVVIGILASISIVAYSGIQNRARTTVVQSDLRTVGQLMELHVATNGTATNSLAALNDGAGFTPSNGVEVQIFTFGSNYCVQASTGGGNNYHFLWRGESMQEGGCVF